MKKLQFTLALLVASASLLSAQVVTEAVGFVSVTALGNSDTRFAVPLHRPTFFVGSVVSKVGNVITVQNTANWTTDQFVYSAGTQNDHFYIEIQSNGSSAEGKRFDIASNTANTLTVVGDASGIVVNDVFEIIPYWTYGTLLPASTSGITATTSISGAGSATKILVPDTTSPGTNLITNATYYYYGGAASGGPGWRKSGGGLTTIRNNDIISPSSYLIVRQDGVATATISGTGSVPMAKRVHIIGTKLSGVAQDNFVQIDIPIPVTLTDSGLWESGVFTASASVSGSNGDKLLVYDDSMALKNKVPSKTYYYYNGAASGGPGWRLQGGGLTTIRNGEVAFSPGSGVVIRKQATTPAQTLTWAPLPTYLTP